MFLLSEFYWFPGKVLASVEMFDSEVLNIVKERVTGMEGTALDWFSSDLSESRLIAWQSLTATSNMKHQPFTARKLEQDLAHMGLSCWGTDE